MPVRLQSPETFRSSLANTAKKRLPTIADFVIEQAIRLVVVGPEAPLVVGIQDYFAHREDLRDVGIVGPDQTGARLEGSKDYAKAFMQQYGVPTAPVSYVYRRTARRRAGLPRRFAASYCVEG